MDLAELTLATFEPRVGDAFTIAATPTPIELVLSSAIATGAWPGGRQPFSLTFRGPCEPLLAQGIRRVEHEALGALEIFVVPLGRDSESTTYEAVFT